MKLRIQGNSLRLRLTRSEVAQLCRTGGVESTIEFTPESSLQYAVRCSPDAKLLTASFDGHSIVVLVPAAKAAQWANGNQVSIEGSHHDPVQLLVEKDFQCMHKPAHADPDAYPNPLA